MHRYVTCTVSLTEWGSVVLRINRSDNGSASPNVPNLTLFSHRSHAMAEQHYIWQSICRIQT